ncbi:MAG: SHOCT domain-containing protein [Thermodesulfovibrionia bacterium]|nr:SHOCT domain-containing protein [Thermodesulfovibrionia bacterium]
MHWGDYGWGMGFGWIFMIIFWGLVILGIVYLIQVVSKGTKKEDTETPLDILKKRYAKGEITKEEYERMKDDLTRD